MNTVRNWFSPANRERVYTAIAALAPILVTAGIVLPGQVEPILAIVAAALQAFGGALALSNLRPNEAARWFGTVGRGVIYTGATSVAVAVVALGVVTQDWANTALQYTSFGLTAFAAILAVVTPKDVTVGRDEIEKIDAVVIDDAVLKADDVSAEVVATGAISSMHIAADAISVQKIGDGGNAHTIDPDVDPHDINEDDGRY